MGFLYSLVPFFVFSHRNLRCNGGGSLIFPSTFVDLKTQALRVYIYIYIAFIYIHIAYIYIHYIYICYIYMYDLIYIHMEIDTHTYTQAYAIAETMVED